MTYRKATLNDLSELVEMFELYRVYYKQKRNEAGASKFLTDRIKDNESIIFVAENDTSQLVGFTQLYPLFSSTRMKRTWLLNDLFVRASHRNEGIAKMLIDQAKELVRETNALGVNLETERTNDPGNHLYPSVGFQLDTEHNFYFWMNDESK